MNTLRQDILDGAFEGLGKYFEKNPKDFVVKSSDEFWNEEEIKIVISFNIRKQKSVPSIASLKGSDSSE